MTLAEWIKKAEKFPNLAVLTYAPVLALAREVEAWRDARRLYGEFPHDLAKAKDAAAKVIAARANTNSTLGLSEGTT